MPDYSNLRNMSLGGNNSSIFGKPFLLNLGDNPFNLQHNPFTVGSFGPAKLSITNVGNTQDSTSEETGVGNNILNIGKSLAGSIKSGGYDMLSQGMSLLNGFMGSNVENDSTYNRANNALSTVGSIVGMTNPIAGLAIKGVQTGLNLINNLGGKRANSYSIDQDTRQYMGSGYQGSYSMMDEAQSKSGKKYGLFNTSARKRANRMIAEAKRQENIIQNINEENQDYLAMGNNQLNALNYTNELNGGLDFRYMRAAKVGIKLDLLNRTRKIQTKEVINLNTKQLDEFVPIITPAPIDKFKDGGIIQEEFVPIITEAPKLQNGGNIEKAETELVELEDTNQKNVIPDGALHKNKHHMEHAEGLTSKGIPVIDNDREQQAEIELNEIIFTLEVTKKLEKLYELYKNEESKDQAAIEAGKLLVQEILYNTDDKTGLIAKCKEGGKLQ